MSRSIIDSDTTRPAVPLGRGQLVVGLRSLGLQTGDRVLVHTSLSSFGTVEGGAATVLDALQVVLGSQGTLVMPYFYPLYDGDFDYAQPPVPYTGALPRRLRVEPQARLSLHPSHAVVALGPEAGRITADHHLVSAVGRGSPIDRLAGLGGKVLLLGVSQAANTTLHTGEAYAGVGYWGRARPDRPTGRWVRLPDGQRTWVPLPETPGDSDGFPRIEPFLVERGLIRQGLIGRARCRLMPAQQLIEATVAYLRRDPGGLLCERAGCAFCAWARQFLPP
jgi:aminoglycoside 3-N-acetyltransferase